MKIFAIIISLIISVPLYSQEPETIRVKLKKKSEGGSKYKIDYHVLKSDTSIKHGEYKRYNVIRDLVESGFYDHGVKDSTWKTYSAGKMVNSVGVMKNGKREGHWDYCTNIPGGWHPTLTKSGDYLSDRAVGIWTYYYRNGEIEQKYDHSLDSLIFQALKNEKAKYLVQIDTVETLKHLDRPPLLIGGNIASSENWQKMNHSELLRVANDKEDLSYELTFWISSNGETYNYNMTKGVNAEYDNLIIEHYKEHYNWIPAVLNDENVDCRFVVKVNYTVHW